ncbi:Hypothetical predicted protein, partial [Paramuricea clavata]
MVASCFSGEIQSFGKDHNMFSKILFVLGVVLAISTLGSASGVKLTTATNSTSGTSGSTSDVMVTKFTLSLM